MHGVKQSCQFETISQDGKWFPFLEFQLPIIHQQEFYKSRVIEGNSTKCFHIAGSPTVWNGFPLRQIIPHLGMVCHRVNSFPLWEIVSQCHHITRSCIHSPTRIVHIQQQNEVLLARWRPCTVFISVVVHINHLEDFESINVVRALCDNATTSYAGQWTLRDPN